jgi:hypothetical protein
MQGLSVLVGAIQWFMLLAIPVTAATILLRRRRYGALPARERRRSLSLDVLLALSVLGITTVSLLPIADYHTGLAWGLQLRPFASIERELASAVSPSVAVRIVGFNVLLFVPLGVALRLRTRRWAAILAVVFATSVAVEVLQGVLPLGRTPNVDDIILNTFGGILGAVGARVALQARWRRSGLRTT